MKHLLAVSLLALAGCAHGGGVNLPAQPHAPLGLEGPTGLDDQQEEVLEGAICQAMVEVNKGDVDCPSARRATLELARSRALMTGTEGPSVEMATARVPHHLTAAVTKSGGEFVMKLDYFETVDGKPKASSQLSEGTFDDLVLKSPDAVKALLQ